MKKYPSCPTCGRQYEGALPINGRVCPKCLIFKAHSMFPTKTGMCDTCRDIKARLREKTRAHYHRDYYLRVTKPKRQTASRLIDLHTRIEDAVDIFKPLEKYKG